jgi:Tfp pilus assembly protein PilN
MPRRRVNLVPREVELRRKQRRLVTNAIGAGVVVLALLVLVFIAETVRVSGAHHDLAVQQQRNAQLRSQIDELAEFEQLQKRVKEKTDLLAGLTRNEVRWSVLLADISLVIPSDAWLTNLSGSLTPPPTGAAAATANPSLGQLLLNGTTFSHLDVAKWLTQLSGVKEFLDPYLSLSAKSVIGTTPTVNFTSTVNLSEFALRAKQAGAERHI